MRARFVTVLLLLALCPGSAALGHAPEHVWSDLYGGTTGDNQYGMDVVTDAGGDVYVTGYFYANIDLGGGLLTSSGGSDIFLAKFDSSGNHLWSRVYGGAGYEVPFAIALDAAGGIVLTGRFTGTGNFGGSNLTAVDAMDAFVARYASDGSHAWSAAFGGTGDDIGLDIAAFDEGSVAVVGEFDTSINFGLGALTSAGGADVFLVRFTSAGGAVFSRSFGNTGEDEGRAVAIDRGNTVYLGGSARVSIDFGGGVLTCAGYTDAFLAAFDKGGAHQWSALFGDSGYQFGEELACDSGNNVVFTGYFGGTINLGGGTLAHVGTYDMFMAKFSSAGGHLWSRAFGLSGWNYEADLGVDGDDDILMSSRCSGSVDFGGDVLTTHGSSDICVAKFAADGSHLWSGIFGSASADYTRGAAVMPDGGLVNAGYFSAAVDFGGGPLVPSGASDAYLVRFADPPLAEITSIEDVGNDQGRAVRIEFLASPRDAAGSPTPILQYEAYRRIDELPGAAALAGRLPPAPAVAGTPVSRQADKLAGWDFVGAVPAHGESAYSLIAPTLADSTIAHGQYLTTFLIRAATADPYTFWDSYEAAGYSLDNLAPGAPEGLSMATGELLVWQEVDDADFDYYTVYASATPDFASPVVVGRTAAAELAVAGTGGDYLAVTATDFAGNESGFSPYLRNLTDVPNGGMARAFALHPCVPNPFNPLTSLCFDLPRDEWVSLRVYALDGRLVTTLVASALPAGRHVATWNGRDSRGLSVPSGTYVSRLTAGSLVQTQRMQLVK